MKNKFKINIGAMNAHISNMVERTYLEALKALKEQKDISKYYKTQNNDFLTNEMYVNIIKHMLRLNRPYDDIEEIIDDYLDDIEIFHNRCDIIHAALLSNNIDTFRKICDFYISRVNTDKFVKDTAFYQTLVNAPVEFTETFAKFGLQNQSVYVILQMAIYYDKYEIVSYMDTTKYICSLDNQWKKIMPLYFMDENLFCLACELERIEIVKILKKYAGEKIIYDMFCSAMYKNNSELVEILMRPRDDIVLKIYYQSLKTFAICVNISKTAPDKKEYLINETKKAITSHTIKAYIYLTQGEVKIDARELIEILTQTDSIRTAFLLYNLLYKKSFPQIEITNVCELIKPFIDKNNLLREYYEMQLEPEIEKLENKKICPDCGCLMLEQETELMQKQDVVKMNIKEIVNSELAKEFKLDAVISVYRGLFINWLLGDTEEERIERIFTSIFEKVRKEYFVNEPETTKIRAEIIKNII
ncbi:MAG: hypothetical protein ACYCPT_12205 [Acidimicrobiales bacterium]